MPRNRRICVVITARPTYSRFKTALQAIQAHPSLDLQLVVGASAILDRYGNVAEIMRGDGLPITETCQMLVEGANPLAQAQTTGLGIINLAQIFGRLAPDLVVTIADRYETLATAVAASYSNIPCVHIQGGESTGSIDDKVRHAITQLADQHYVSTEMAAARVIASRYGGTPSSRVVTTGCPSIDLCLPVLESPRMNFDPITRYGGVGATFKVPDRGYIVVMQHPVTNEFEAARDQITETLRAVYSSDLPAYWMWPNPDAGADGTSTGIRHFRESNRVPQIHWFKTLEPEDFLRLLYNSTCIVGNSSVAIRECSYLGVPAINIGTRQIGRECGRNVTHVGHNAEEIVEAIKTHPSQHFRESSSLYGDGHAGQRIATLLATCDL